MKAIDFLRSADKVRLMSRRINQIFPEEIYHVFNRSVAKQPIFLEARDYQRFLGAVNFYRFISSGIRFSYFNRFGKELQNEFMSKLEKKDKKQVSIISFCLMTNHFHFLLKGITDRGVQKFAANVQNSYAKYFNTKRNRSGALFQEMFKAVRIETDEQLVHTSRYIHLNPFSSSLVDRIEDLKIYPWSSLSHYLGLGNIDFIERGYLEDFFSSKKDFETFTFDQADYQKQLDWLKHFALE